MREDTFWTLVIFLLVFLAGMLLAWWRCAGSA